MKTEMKTETKMETETGTGTEIGTEIGIEIGTETGTGTETGIETGTRPKEPRVEEGKDGKPEQSSREKGNGRPRSRVRRTWDFVIWFCKDQWFLLGTCVVTVIASQVQVPPQHQAVKQVAVTYAAVSVIFFITGCTLDTQILINNYAKWKQHVFIQVQCFLMVSALAYAVVSLAATSTSFMNPWLLIGLIFNACQPTAMASNVLFTRQSHGNAALTVVETTIGNFLGPFLSPVLIRMYLSSGAWYTKVLPDQAGGYQAIYRRVFMQLGLSIYLPMVVGQILRYFFSGTMQKIFVDWNLRRLGSIGQLCLLWQTWDHAFSTGGLSNLKASNIVFIVFITIFNYFLWLTICVVLSNLFFNRKDTVAVAMCVPAKTLALGLPLSFLLYIGLNPLDQARIQVPLVIFQMMQMGMASLCTFGFRRWVDVGEKMTRTSSATEAVEEKQDGYKLERDQLKEAAPTGGVRSLKPSEHDVV